MTALTKIESPNFTPALSVQANELSQVLQISTELAKAPFYSKMGVGGIMAVWLTAKELGLPPMMCLNGALYTFDGKVTMSAQLMNMMIVNRGHRVDILQLDDTACELQFVRSDRTKGHGDTFKYRFTIEMAIKAGYMTKNNWKQHTRDMLFARTLSGGARKFMPDVLMNCYVFGEIEDASFSDSHLVNVMPESVVTHVPQIEFISSEQAEVISDLSSQCDNDFMAKINSFIKDKGGEDINKMPASLFIRIKERLEKYIAENEPKKKEDPQPEEPIDLMTVEEE